MVLVAAACWALHAVLGRKYAERCAPLKLTVYGALVGTALFAPLAATEMAHSAHRLGEVSARFWISVASLGLLASIAAYWLWYRALDTCEASLVAVYMYLEPLVASAAGVLVLGERLTLGLVAGGALILAGLFLAHEYSPAGVSEAVCEGDE